MTLEDLLMTWSRRIFFDFRGSLKRSQTGGGVAEDIDDRELVVFLDLFLLGPGFGG